MKTNVGTRTYWLKENNDGDDFPWLLMMSDSEFPDLPPDALFGWEEKPSVDKLTHAVAEDCTWYELLEAEMRVGDSSTLEVYEE